MIKKCYAYIRVSTIKQDEEGTSLLEQRSAIENYAKKLGIEIIDWFEERETAAKRGRPQFNKLISHLRKRKDAGVIIHKIDRSARNLKDWADLGELIDGGIEVHFAHESLDMKSRGGRLAADIQAVVAADFIRNLRDEVRKGMRGCLKQGLFPNKAPIGYLNTGKGNAKEIDPIRAPLVLLAFELYATGNYNLMQLRDKLFDMGLRSSSGRSVEKSVLSRMLNNSFYYGRIFIRRTGDSYAGIHKPIISVALYEEVQEKLFGKKKNTGLKRKYLFQKMLHCYACKRFLIPELQKSRYIYYRCHTGGCATKCIREELVTGQLTAQLSSLGMSNEEIQRASTILEEMKNRLEGRQDSQKQSLRLERGKLDERLRRLTDLVIDGTIDKDSYDAKRQLLLDEKFRADEKIAEIDAGRDLKAETVGHMLELVKSLHNKDFSDASSELIGFAKSTISNFCIFQKQLIPTWGFPLSEVVQSNAVAIGVPYHPTSRTLDFNKLLKFLEETENDKEG